LTATLIKNNLMEGFGIYQVIMPNLFQLNDRPMTQNQFMLYYCLTRMQRIPRSNRQIPVIVGYTPQRIQEFREVIAPYFIGRPKHEVASELPTLTSRTIEFDLANEQVDKYLEALEGLLEIGEGDDSVVKEVSKLTGVTYCQEIINHLGLIDCEGRSAKLDLLLDLLTDGDFVDEKVIIFTRFRKMVDLMMPVLARKKIKAVRLTGAENENQRAQAMAKFQNFDDETRVICITTAGSEAVNLQAAKAIICYDTPWSAGDFLQLLGRMIRIGSVHDKCYMVHLLGRQQKKQTMDHRVMQVLGKKMELVEAVLGKRIKGEGDEQVTIEVRNEISDLFSSLRQDALDEKGK
jgi:SNF2 family DNA or RNA helicase